MIERARGGLVDLAGLLAGIAGFLLGMFVWLVWALRYVLLLLFLAWCVVAAFGGGM